MARKHSKRGAERQLNSQCRQCTSEKGARGGWSVQKYFNSGKGEEGVNRAGKGEWSKTGDKKGGKGQEKGGKGDARVCWSRGKTGHIAANCALGCWNGSLNAVEEDKRRHQ